MGGLKISDSQTSSLYLLVHKMEGSSMSAVQLQKGYLCRRTELDTAPSPLHPLPLSSLPGDLLP